MLVQLDLVQELAIELVMNVQLRLMDVLLVKTHQEFGLVKHVMPLSLSLIQIELLVLLLVLLVLH
jgi:hypothetical protein